MGTRDAIVAGHLSALARMVAQWRAGYPLAKEEFEALCKYEWENIRRLEEHIAHVADMIAKLAQMLKQAYTDMVRADKELQAAKERLSVAGSGSPEASAAQADVARCTENYRAARWRHMKINEKKKEEEDFKARLDKDLEKWKDALAQFRKTGEQRLLELEKQHQQLEAQADRAIQLTQEGQVRGA